MEHIEYMREMNLRLDSMDPEEIIAWAHNKFGSGLAMSSSFGADSAVMLNMTARTLSPVRIPVFFSDTGYHFPETLAYVAEMTTLLDLDIRMVSPAQSTDEFEREHGRLWETDMRSYNHHRKVRPMVKAWRDGNVTAILSGIRKDQTETRNGTLPLEFRDGIFRISPLLTWTQAHLNQYLELRDLPRNPLVARGITSIGDMHTSGKDRANRFRGDDRMECGLHVRDGAAFDI